MACDSEKNNYAAALLAEAAACATIETGIGILACAAAVYNAVNAGEALDDCLQKQGLASIAGELNQMYSEAQTLEAAASAAGIAA
jgi:hypothetical protein